MNNLALSGLLARLGAGIAGLSTGGTSSTIIDTVNRTEVNGYWNGMQVVILSGLNAGLARTIKDFDSATDTITVDLDFPAAVIAGVNYVILPRATSAALTDVSESASSIVKTAPPAAAGVTVTAGAAGLANKGAYAQVLATGAITTKSKFVAVCVSNPSALDDFEIDLATGAGGAEVVKSTHRFSLDGVNDSARIMIPSSPVNSGPPANTRLAARVSSTAGGTTADVCIEYIDGLS